MARVFRFGDGISTDAIMPGRYNLTTDGAKLAEACFIENRPDFHTTVRRGDVIVAGKNFGCGSSREHAPLSIRESGVSVVIARTFARIFYRNAVNLGLPVMVCDELYTAVGDGDQIEVDVETGVINTGGRTFQGEPQPAVARVIRESGSLVALIREKGWAAIEEAARV
jgi:3-isopropylmalate dehydratase small subunit